MTSNKTHCFAMPNPTTTRIPYDRQSKRRKLQIFHTKIFEFLMSEVDFSFFVLEKFLLSRKQYLRALFTRSVKNFVRRACLRRLIFYMRKLF